jgi:hypothetical protein
MVRRIAPTSLAPSPKLRDTDEHHLLDPIDAARGQEFSGRSAPSCAGGRGRLVPADGGKGSFSREFSRKVGPGVGMTWPKNTAATALARALWEETPAARADPRPLTADRQSGLGILR